MSIHLTKRIQSEISNNFQRWSVNLLLLAVAYGLCVAVLGDDALPFSPFFTLLLIWITSLIFGIVFGIVHMPQLLGQLMAGILLRNIPGDALRGLRESWIAGVRNVALSFVLMRAGLGTNVREARSLGAFALLVAIIPGLCESIVIGLLGNPLFGFPWALSFANGFIIAAVSAAVVVVEILELRSQGFGEGKGIPTLLIVAVTIDIVFAVSGYTLASGLAYGTGSLVWNILFGPVNVIAGVSAGALGGMLLWMSSFVGSKWKMCLFLILGNIACVFAFQLVRFTGAASVCSVLMPIVAVIGWKHAYPSPWITPKNSEEDLNKLQSNANHPQSAFQNGIERLKLKLSWLQTEEHPEYIALCVKVAALVWSIIVGPVLFGTIGTALDFTVMKASVFGKAAGMIAIGVVVRILSGLLVLIGSPLNANERWYISISMTAKATIQAALGGSPLQFYLNRPESTPQEIEWADQILTIAVLSILFTAAPGTVFMRYFGPRWLSDDCESSTENIPEESSSCDVKSEDAIRVVDSESQFDASGSAQQTVATASGNDGPHLHKVNITG
uniref:Cation/H+ exchanger transmembrane domain-containing protein n=1 Tax=Timspurckia oligopyrenoides TaxID=708627 RepID=A0A7S0ZBN0_9RHOD|mmetsp:Transcript_11496/g.20778  ORF Transcript_11496/g.20778 Transcript_11496/m.20778 type:complete len:558 (+) Transcript_11496:113-1786(+)